MDIIQTELTCCAITRPMELTTALGSRESKFEFNVTRTNRGVMASSRTQLVLIMDLRIWDNRRTNHIIVNKHNE